MAYLKHGSEIPTKGRGSKLTGKQLLFVEAYCNPEGGSYQNGAQSVIKAGYITKNHNKVALQLMQHPLVKTEIQSRMADRQERMALSGDYIIYKLMDIVEETAKDGDRIRALELLGKTLALFKERQEISGPDGEAIQMEQRVNLYGGVS